MASQALKDVKVVEYAHTVAGAYCGKLLADMGADVIKVEAPEGDPLRKAGPFPESGSHPEKSALFLYLNTSKKSVVLDPASTDGTNRFKTLTSWADILIDDHMHGHLETIGLGYKILRRLNPRLDYVRITPYGCSGPRAGVKGDDLTLIHAGGLGNLLPARSVDIDLPPVKLGGYPVGYHGGIAAAIACLGGYMAKKKCGQGQLIDVSLQEVVINLVGPVVASHRYHQTTWSRVPDRPPAMGRMETSDGYVILNAFDDHHFKAFRELMGNPEWADSDAWDDRGYRTHHLMDIAPMMEAWMRQQKKKEVYLKAAEKGIPIGPVNTAADVMAHPQYASRQYFVDVDHPAAGKFRYAGWPYKMSESPPGISRPAPLLGEHTEAVMAQISSSQKKDDPAREDVAVKPRSGMPLEGLRVLDFSWVWAGPYACMLLASLGAEVIKIEGHKRTDILRRTFPWPLSAPAPVKCPPNQGMSYNQVNLNKKSLTLDLSRPEGKELARQLAASSDMVIDNMRPGVMEKLGLGYEALKKIRSDIIVIASSSQGYGGPYTHHLGFATIHHGIGGGTHITGHPEDHPSHGANGDVDILNATTTAYAALAALIYRNRTGKGQFIDYSQSEGVSSIIGEQLLGFEMTAKMPERMGNAHPVYAPHNVYRCWGVDRWLALEIHSDGEFEILADLIQCPELKQDARFSNMALRKSNEKALDAIITSWTRDRDRDWMVETLAGAGLAAAPSRNGKDIYADPHLRARNSFMKVDHPELGLLELIAPPWRFEQFDIPQNPAPLLGQHNEYVLGSLLGLTANEIHALRKKEIIS